MASDNTQLSAKVLTLLPASLQNLLRDNAKRELLTRVDAVLLVFDGFIYDLESGQSLPLDGVIAGTEATQSPRPDAAILAQQAASLLKNSSNRNLLLLLPPSEFVATGLSMPGVMGENLLSAVNLQSDSLLPAFESTLSLAINTDKANDSHVALWIAEERLSDCFDALAAKGIFLAAVLPRILAASSLDSQNARTIDSDSNGKTFVELQDGVLVRWQHIHAMDLEQEDFLQQWNEEIGLLPGTAEAENDPPQNQEMQSAQQYFGAASTARESSYNFYPQGALSARKKLEKGKRIGIGAVAVFAALLLAAVPFLIQVWELRSLEGDLVSQKNFSADARSDQAVVVNFESEWGPLNDYPEQRISDVMFRLVSVLSPERLTSLEISQGLVRIQGTSAEPQGILQRLEQDPMFTEVVFSRATSNSRYYIDLRLSTVNFEGYMVRYFPDEN